MTVLLLAMTSTFLAQVQQEPGTTDAKHIEQLVRDLGGDQAARNKARRELKDIGRPALPYLKRASDDPDAERAMAARSLLLEMIGKDGTDGKPYPGAPEVQVIYKDWAKGIDFEREENGHIRLTVPQEDPKGGNREFKTYEADSLDEFTKRYPEVARKYEVDKLASPREISKDLTEEWNRFRKMLERPGFGPDAWDSWIERHEKAMERHLHDREDRESDPAEPGREGLGILVGPLPASLTSQLGLKEHQGLLVYDVRSGSLAEKSGLHNFDVLTKLNGREITDAAMFRNEVEKALKTDRFTVEIRRSAKTEQIDVRPESGRKRP